MTESKPPLATTQKPPEAWSPLVRLLEWTARPIDRFLHVEASSGIVLLVATAIALGLANSPWSHEFHHFWQTPVGLSAGPLAFTRPLEWWINDGAMVVFFFVVGMEIRREIHCGELATFQRALLPGLAAVGGMLAPALLYLSLVGAPGTHAGWGVPMATDIAFAVGVLALLGSRVPPALRVLLLALAVIDDLGAILVIALFYSQGVQPWGFVVAAGGLGAIFALQRFGVRNKAIYVLPALVTWAGTYAAGVHPTIAGVVIGLCTPVRAWLGKDGFVEEVARPLHQAERGDLSSSDWSWFLQRVDVARREARSPLEGLVEALHPWVAFVIMPLFALANAGVSLGGVDSGAASWQVGSAAFVGLVVGKPLGVVLFCQLSLWLGWTQLPRGLSFRHLLVLGAVAGIGFTMALFVAQLAFDDGALLGAAKLGVLAASIAAGVLGIGLGLLLLRDRADASAASSAHEAENSTEL